jgi:CDP-4-dehydro-6-deoxyglucose reductase, E3
VPKSIEPERGAMDELHLIRLQPSGHQVVCEPGETVLSALERAGYALANNCRAGACGECKTKVLAGEYDQGMVLDMALASDERAAGYGLMCMAKPTSEILDIEYGTGDALPKLFPPRTGVRFVVTDRIRRTPRIVEIRLRPIGDNLRYWPGQYLMVGDEASGVPARPYSIANAPRPDGEISLLVAHVPGGATSGWIHDAVEAGARVSVSGPYGTFVGDPAVEGPVLCLAAGSGLAPILALTDAALRRGFRYPVTVVLSARHPDDVFDVGPMAWWTARHRQFRFVVCRTGAGELAPGQRQGRVSAVLPELFDDLHDHSVFIAGSPEFVADCVTAVHSLGARPELIYVEGYHAQAPAEMPPTERLAL